MPSLPGHSQRGDHLELGSKERQELAGKWGSRELESFGNKPAHRPGGRRILGRHAGELVCSLSVVPRTVYIAPDPKDTQQLNACSAGLGSNIGPT